MPREYKKEATRTDLRTARSAPVSSQVVARPVDTYIQPARQTNNLLDALSVISPSLSRFAQYQEDKQFTAGQQAAEQLTPEELNAKIKSGEIRREGTYAFQDGYLQLHGLRTAKDIKSKLQAALVDPNQFNPDTDNVDELYDKFVSEAAAVNDDSYQSGFMRGISGTRDELRAWHQDYQAKAIRQQVNNDYFSIVQDSLKDALAQGGNLTPADLAALKADAVDIFGLTKKEFEEIAFEAAHTVGMEGVPEAYDIFFQKRNDGTPGLASTKDWGEKIKQAQLQAQRIRDSVTSEADQEAIFLATDRLKEITARDALNWTEADYKAEALKYVKKGILSGSVAAGFVDTFRTEKVKQEHIAMLANEFRRGRAVMYSDDPAMDDAVDAAIKPILEKAAAEGDPAKGIGQALELLQQSGINVKYKPWKNILEGVVPANEAQFKEGAMLYRSIKDASPTYLASLLSEERDIMFQLYWDAQEFGGADEQQALAVVHNYGSPEFKSQAEMMLRGEAGRKLMSDVKTQMINSTWKPNWAGGRDEALNSIKIQQKVRDLAVMRMLGGSTSVENAVDWAIDRTMRTHKFIKGRWLNMGPLPVYEGFEEDLTTFLDDLPKQLEADGFKPSEGGYFADATPMTLKDGKLRIFDAYTGFPTGKTIDIKKMSDARAKRIREETIKQNIEERKLRQVKKEHPVTGGPAEHPIYGDTNKQLIDFFKNLKVDPEQSTYR